MFLCLPNTGGNMLSKDVLDRFAPKFWRNISPEPNSGCWLWTAASNGKNYGAMWVGSTTCLAHRFSYMLHKGPISSSLEIDHTCRVTFCVNPDHLEAVPHVVNVRRGDRGKYQRERTHCAKGHPFDEENTYRYKDNVWKRGCVICRRFSAKMAARRSRAARRS